MTQRYPQVGKLLLQKVGQTLAATPHVQKHTKLSGKFPGKSPSVLCFLLLKPLQLLSLARQECVEGHGPLDHLTFAPQGDGFCRGFFIGHPCCLVKGGYPKQVIRIAHQNRSYTNKQHGGLLLRG